MKKFNRKPASNVAYSRVGKVGKIGYTPAIGENFLVLT
jgi:hypothetical protein